MFPKTTVLGNFYVRGANKYTKLVELYKPFEIAALRDKIKNKVLIWITYHINGDTQKISSQKSEVLLW